ncbi:glycosyltransferase [Hyphomonas beringensis]|uniref:glycosyltransferase n=1 Tax=Hyphomonas beringensis TaxID=1280946 RepID=UPI000555EA5C|nr:glycosyltransferase [Hyphomonas beringensis]
MNILFVTAHPHTPQIAGGSQSSTHELSLEIRGRGHNVSVLSGLYHKDRLGFLIRAYLKLTGQKFVRDTLPGYPVYRKWFVWEDGDRIIRRAKPDVIIVSAGKPFKTAKHFAQFGIPLVVYVRDVEFHKYEASPDDLPDNTVYVANSEFTANAYREKYGIEAVPIPPMFMAERYRCENRKPEVVSFINPHPDKGRNVAFQIAERCPDIPFEFIEGWPLPDAIREENVQLAEKCGNVTLKPRTNDMKTIYGRTKVLLIPSQWREAWGRIASEAHFSGIPCVATKIGGLSESVGDGGILIEPDAPIEEWVNAVRKLWDDQNYYKHMSEQALTYSQRPTLNKDHQLDTLLGACEKARENWKSAG